MTLETSTVDLQEIIDHVKGYTEQSARNGHLEIRWNEEADLPAIATDAVKLEEILQNLIGNAYKFTPQGEIVIGVRDLKEDWACRIHGNGYWNRNRITTEPG